MLNINEMKPTKYLRQTGYDRTVASRVVVELKERSGYQLVVPWNGEESLLWERDEEETLVLLGVGAVSGFVGILRSLEVRPPPVSYYL